MPLISKPHSFNGDFRKRMGFFFLLEYSGETRSLLLKVLAYTGDPCCKKGRSVERIKSREGISDFKVELEKTHLPRVYPFMIQQVKVTS
jgi:hypothetical protein